MLAILAVGAIVRVVHLWALHRSPLFSLLQLDARYYDQWAREIAGGKWVGSSAFWMDPLYAYVLGLAYALFGHDLWIPRLLNAALGLATAWVVARTATRIWASRSAGLLAAAAMVLFVPALHLEGEPEKTALSVFLFALTLELFTIATPRALVGCGVALGFATLARGNSALLLPFAVLALAIGGEKPTEVRSEDARSEEPPISRWRRFQPVARLLMGALPVMALATVHNAVAVGQLIPTTTNFGINLYLGNHSGNQWGYYAAPSFLHADTQSEGPSFRAEAQRRTGETFDDRSLSRYWAGQAFHEMGEHPGLTFGRTFRKIKLALHQDEVPDSDSVELAAEWSPVLRSPVLWFGQLLPLALLGAVIGFRRWGVRVAAAAFAIYLASLLPFFVMARLRLPLLPAASILAAGALVWLKDAAAARNGSALARAAGLLVVAALICFYRPGWMAEQRTSSLAVTWNNLGAGFLDRGDRENAIRAYERAVAIRAEAVPASLRALGQVYREKGELQNARRVLERLVQVRPDSLSARAALAALYEQISNDPRFAGDPELAQRRRNLSTSGTVTEGARAAPASRAMGEARRLEASGHAPEAVALLQNAVEQGPYDENLHYFLGDMMERHAPADAMLQFFAAEAGRDQKPQTSHYFQAVALERLGRAAGAIDELKRALEIDPAHEMSQRRWGLLLEHQGDDQQALSHLLEATKIHPEFRAALEDAGRVAERLGRRDEAAELRRRAQAANPGTVRQFLYWARYLHDHRRDDAAWAETDRMLAVRPNDPETLALRHVIRPSTAAALPAGADWSLGAEQRLAFRRGVQAASHAVPISIVFDARDRGAEALARDLGAEAGAVRWPVRRLAPANIALKPGLFLFAANAPSDDCRAVAKALESAGFKVTFGSGYRAFVEERRRMNPAFAALDLDAGEDFLLAVGRKPTPGP